jgi:hypothetical protein
MNHKLNQLFKNIKDLEPSYGLEVFILAKTEAMASKQAKRKLILSYFGILGSALAAFYLVLIFGEGIAKSEFFSLMSLAFSDLSIVLINWKDFAYSLLETFPVIYTAIIIAPIFTLFLSISSYLNNHNHNKHYSAT